MSDLRKLDSDGHVIIEDTNAASPYAPGIPGNVVEHNDGEDHTLTNEETVAAADVVRTEKNTEPRYLDGDKEVQGGPPRVVDGKTDGVSNPDAVEGQKPARRATRAPKE